MLNIGSNSSRLLQPFEIETNASKYAIWAILMKLEYPIPYHLEDFNKNVWNYWAYDRELYSIVQVVPHWEHYYLSKMTTFIMTINLCIYENMKQDVKRTPTCKHLCKHKHKWEHKQEHAIGETKTLIQVLVVPHFHQSNTLPLAFYNNLMLSSPILRILKHEGKFEHRVILT